jgi:hypothetical protein
MNAPLPLPVLIPLAELPQHDFGLDDMMDCFFGNCEEEHSNVIDLDQWRARKSAS